MDQQATMTFQGPQPIQNQTVQQTVASEPERPETLPHSKWYKWLGIVQMCIGSLCVILSIAGLIVGPVHYRDNDRSETVRPMGSGIYTGIFIIITGLLGFLTYKGKIRSLEKACIMITIMNTISVVVACVGFAFVIVELTSLKSRPVFHKAKCAMLLSCWSVQWLIHIAYIFLNRKYFLNRRSDDYLSPVIRPVAVHPSPQKTIVHSQAWQLPVPQQQYVIVQKPGHSVTQQIVHVQR